MCNTVQVSITNDHISKLSFSVFTEIEDFTKKYFNLFIFVFDLQADSFLTLNL